MRLFTVIPNYKFFFKLVKKTLDPIVTIYLTFKIKETKMITKWHVKDLSRITNISVQTLHYYDNIDLLKPSLRMSNGYRIYSETDLLKLQQIIALKFFGFELKKIKTLLTGKVDAFEHFLMQAQLLEKKTKVLFETSQMINEIISECSKDKSITWKAMIKLIEVYQMTQQLESSWVKEIYTQKELTEYADFKSELMSSSNTSKKDEFEREWAELNKEIKNNIDKDPRSDIGTTLANKFMLWTNRIYGKKYAHLRTKKFEQGFTKGKGLEEIDLTREEVKWIENAVDYYYRSRIYTICSAIGRIPSSESRKLFNEVLDEMYGDDINSRQNLIKTALQDDQISTEARKWLGQYSLRK